MEPLGSFPDIEAAVVARIEELDGVTVGTFTPDDLKARMPFVLVYRFAGSDDYLQDRADVGIDVFAGTRGVGLPLAESVRQLITAAPYYVNAAVIDSVTTSQAPHEVPYGDTAVRRWVSSYSLTVRR